MKTSKWNKKGSVWPCLKLLHPSTVTASVCHAECTEMLWKSLLCGSVAFQIFWTLGESDRSEKMMGLGWKSAFYFPNCKCGWKAPGGFSCHISNKNNNKKRRISASVCVWSTPGTLGAILECWWSPSPNGFWKVMGKSLQSTPCHKVALFFFFFPF